MRKWFSIAKVALLWAVVFLMTIDSAMACRWLSAWKTRRAAHCCSRACVVAPKTVEGKDMEFEAEAPADVPPPPPVEPEAAPAVEPMQEEVKAAEPAPKPVDQPKEAPKPVEMKEKPKAAEPPPEPMPVEPAPAPEPAPVEPAPAPEPKPVEPAPAPEPAPVEPAPAPEPMPVEPAPAPEPAMPAEEPKEEPAKKDPLDSLFGDLPKEPAAEPAMPGEPAPAAEPAPAEKPAAEPPKDALDDLFGPPAAKPEATPKPQPKAESLDDLFGPPAPAPKPAAADPFGMNEPAELPMRTWVDDTGSFQVTAKLVEILDGKVRLLKDTGKATTVDMLRLSEADQQYVQTLVAQRDSLVIGHLAAR
jgi:hypothetical protein